MDIQHGFGKQMELKCRKQVSVDQGREGCWFCILRQKVSDRTFAVKDAHMQRSSTGMACEWGEFDIEIEGALGRVRRLLGSWTIPKLGDK